MVGDTLSGPGYNPAVIEQPPTGAPEPPALNPAPVTGGAGLRDHSADDPFPRAAGWGIVIVGVVFVAAVAGFLFSANPSLSSGKAMGTSDQIGQLVSASSASAAVPTNLSPDAAAGKKLIGQKGCGGCHVIPGIPGANGSIGPSLAGVANRKQIAGGAVTVNSPADIERWISNPPGIKPGTDMPNLGLNQQEVSQVVAYLELLK